MCIGYVSMKMHTCVRCRGNWDVQKQDGVLAWLWEGTGKEGGTAGTVPGRMTVWLCARTQLSNVLRIDLQLAVDMLAGKGSSWGSRSIRG